MRYHREENVSRGDGSSSGSHVCCLPDASSPARFSASESSLFPHWGRGSVSKGGKSGQISGSPREEGRMAEQRDAGCLLGWDYSSLQLGMATLISKGQAQLHVSAQVSLTELSCGPEYPWGLDYVLNSKERGCPS